jgi:hypothetical protein
MDFYQFGENGVLLSSLKLTLSQAYAFSSLRFLKLTLSA